MMEKSEDIETWKREFNFTNSSIIVMKQIVLLHMEWILTLNILKQLDALEAP